ncbi:MAG: hypothetical protein H6765_04440 [Candidatus Peribacteria bacterium]|nr:MAG: hypothetical protein H6765_04440 [Candidatus Peribacteria bacterium]
MNDVLQVESSTSNDFLADYPPLDAKSLSYFHSKQYIMLDSLLPRQGFGETQRKELFLSLLRQESGPATQQPAVTERIALTLGNRQLSDSSHQLISTL